jgi:predicted SAM-dependent methyltransferase
MEAESQAHVRMPVNEPERAPRRLHWGCGEWAIPGWINSDIKEWEGVDIVCDIRDGLPLETDSIDYAVSIHALPEIPYPEQIPALEELRRVLRPGGVLRLSLPDLDRAIKAYLDRDDRYFLVPDEEVKSTSAKMIVQLLWFGHSRMLFTHELMDELLRKAGYSSVTRCEFQQTASPYPEIVQLDNREQESFFVEAVK